MRSGKRRRRNASMADQSCIDDRLLDDSWQHWAQDVPRVDAGRWTLDDGRWAMEGGRHAARAAVIFSTWGSARQLTTLGRSQTTSIIHHPSAFLRLVLILERRHDVRIGERRRVTERAALGDVAQEAPHDLARSRLRQIRREQDVVGLGDGADLLRNEVAQLVAQ